MQVSGNTAWRRMGRYGVHLVMLAAAVLLAGCQRKAESAAASEAAPTLRLYITSTLAGALEPCGCVSDMLGGVDHAAAYVKANAQAAPHRALVSAGPLLFMNPSLEVDTKTQMLWKAEALALALREMGLVAWAPGKNDWAAGASELARLTEQSGARRLAANLTGTPPGGGSTAILTVGSVRLGLAGVSDLDGDGGPPDGVTVHEARAAALKAKQELETGGAQVFVLLAAMARGEGLRLAESVPGYHVVVLGKPLDRGETNDGPIPPVMIGKTLVVQAPNHLQALGVVDLHVRGGQFEFQDASGVGLSERKEALARRITELDQRIVEWERDGAVKPTDLAARKADRDKAKFELAELKGPRTPETGSFFRYQVVEVREGLGSDARLGTELSHYYKRVNEHNRVAFQDRRPEPPAEGKAGYTGGAACATCHTTEHDFWTKTGHARAYATLARQHKEYNLDCTSCHVTGYDEPGGSTLAHVGELANVQCETCHGPGSLHAKEPTRAEWIIASPKRALCAEKCHHPPHVKPDWDVFAAWSKIVGPGHGR